MGVVKVRTRALCAHPCTMALLTLLRGTVRLVRCWLKLQPPSPALVTEAFPGRSHALKLQPPSPALVTEAFPGRSYALEELR